MKNFVSSHFLALLASAACAFAPAAQAATSDVSASSFESAFHEDVDVAPEQAWQALVNIAGWWSASHTYSGDAANLALEPAAGGCWCERWAGNSVQHARVLVAMPERMLRLDGALGPLQAMGATGILTFRLAPRAKGTSLDVTYRVRASPDAALDKVAAGVDKVLEEQVKRLAASMAKRQPGAPTGEK